MRKTTKNLSEIVKKNPSPANLQNQELHNFVEEYSYKPEMKTRSRSKKIILEYDQEEKPDINAANAQIKNKKGKNQSKKLNNQLNKPKKTGSPGNTAESQSEYDSTSQSDSFSENDFHFEERKKNARIKSKSSTETNKDYKKGAEKYNTKINYEQILEIVKDMRKILKAPVDTQGAGCQSDPNQPKHIRDFQTLTSLLLSVQTKDETTDMVMKRLVKQGFSAEMALEMKDSQLKENIYEVNFNDKKVKYIKNCAQIIQQEYDGKIPNSYETIIKWSGVGPKIANLFMQIAYNRVVGISVDTHLHRISNRFGWVDTKTPEQTKGELEKFVDKKYWREINPLVVGLGQTICKPQNPDCKNCKLNDKCEEGRRRMVGRKKI